MKYVRYILLVLLITVGTVLITYAFCLCLKSDNTESDLETSINNVDISEEPINNSDDELDIDSNLDNVTDVDNNTTLSDNKNTASNKEQLTVKNENSKVESNTSKKEETKQENNNSSSHQENNVSNNTTDNDSSNNNSNSTTNDSPPTSNNDNNNSKPETPKVDEPSKDPTAWEELGISEYDYYHKPIWSWARIDFSVDDYGTEENTHNACISKGNQFMEESTNGLGFSCQSILSYAGNYLGEMMKTF